MNSVWHGIIILQRDCRCDSRQFEDYTEEEEQRDWKKEETNKATYDANILLHQLHTGRIVLERVYIKVMRFVWLFYGKFDEGQFEDYTEEEEQRDW